MYEVSGVTVDYTFGELGIPYSYTVELRGGEGGGLQGFILPPDQIIPSGEEVWAFHMAVAREIIKEFVP